MYSLCDHVGLAYMIRVFMSSYSLHCLSNKKVGIFNTTHNLNSNKANEKGYVNDFSNKLKVRFGNFFKIVLIDSSNEKYFMASQMEYKVNKTEGVHFLAM